MAHPMKSGALVLVVLTHMLCHACVEARRHVDVQSHSGLMHKGTVKTIEGDQNGDIIDCIDIYKQPAFDHPLVKDLQMEPTSYPSGKKMDELEPMLIQSWLNNGECSQGTIPIRRSRTLYQLHKSSPFAFHGLNNSFFAVPNEKITNGHEYAAVTTFGNALHGGHGVINLWNPPTEKQEISISQMWVTTDQDGSSNTNTIEAGWIVYPNMFSDNRARLFIYWTRDLYKNTGCYDLDCPGFVQTNRELAFGAPFTTTSSYNGTQYEVSITMFKDKKTGNWWLQLLGVVLGYWPSSIVPVLANGANRVTWGGETLNTRQSNHHTTTQMGSGHFPVEGYGKSSFIRNLGVIDKLDIQRDPSPLYPIVTNPSCYDVHIGENKQSTFGTYFYYGGSRVFW